MTDESWRGVPTATKRHEFTKLLKVLKPKKTDVYYDLGCGYGNTCRWISKFVKEAVGIESKQFRFKKAIRLTPESRYPNVKFMRRNFFKMPIRKATIIYCTQELTFSDLVNLQKKTKRGTKIIVPELPPPYPIKSKRVWPFFIFQTPFKKVKNPDEYARIYFDKDYTIEEMLKEIPRSSAKSLKWNISRSKNP